MASEILMFQIEPFCSYLQTNNTQGQYKVKLIRFHSLVLVYSMKFGDSDSSFVVEIIIDYIVP